MATAADILVTATDSPRILLVVEAKLQAKDLSGAERQLKIYMTKMGVPIGLIVTPQSIGIYRNRYTQKSEQSIERINFFDVSRSFLKFRQFSSLSEGSPQDKAFAFEEDVQRWLESLRVTGVTEDFSPEAQDAISDYILPALNEGIIRAAHPKEYSTD